MRAGAAGRTRQGAELNDKAYCNVVRTTFKALHETGAADATLFLTEVPVKSATIAWKVSQAAIMAMESIYRFDRLKSKAEETKPPLAQSHAGRHSDAAGRSLPPAKKPCSRDLPLPMV